MANFLKGIIIGIAFIIPGVSGGTLMVLMGLYDKTIYAITNFIKDVKKNVAFLGLLGLGALIGSLMFSKILNYLLVNYECSTKLMFVGLIIGGIPATYNTIIEKKNTKINWYLVLLTLMMSIILYIVEKHFINYSIEDHILAGHIPIKALCLAGVLYACGKIIPGISGSALLMLIGIYNYLIDTLANLSSLTMEKVYVLIPFILSFLISAIVLFKLINYLLSKHYSTTYSLILGFVVGSIIYVFPSFNTSVLNIIISIILGLLGMILTYKLSVKKPVK